jgi:uncharacterized membrane protein YhaH (DUF805 family)
LPLSFDLQPLDAKKLPAQINRPLSGKLYISYGASLMLLKYVIDTIVSHLVFHHPWSFLDYFLPGVLNDFSKMTAPDAHFYLMMLGLALPFAYVGCVLTVRRLRSLGLPPYLVLLFYVPFVNMIFFTVLTLVKSSKEESAAQLHDQNAAQLPDHAAIPRLAGDSAAIPPLVGDSAAIPPLIGDSVETPPRAGDPRSAARGANEIKSNRAQKPTQLDQRLAVRMLDSIPSDGRVGLLASALLPIPVSVLSAIFSVSILQMYGWGVFVAIPFAASIAAVIIYAWKRPRTYLECLLCATICLAGMASVLLLIPFEGIICLLMASPIALGIALVGGSIGYLVQRTMPRNESMPTLLGCFALLVPMLMVGEYLAPPEVPLYVNTSSVVIKAPPQVVWKYLIDFPEMSAPREWVFRTGIAYPIRARIDGHGPGAVRHCIFSTGEFVEPIKVWDQPRLLKFGVLAQAPPMHELSFYSDLHPRHLDNYLVSRNGQFLLTALPNGCTLLDGTTWYQNYMGPSPYWRLWADWIIDRIHMRVLDHVRNLAEHDRGNPMRITLPNARKALPFTAGRDSAAGGARSPKNV